MKRFTFLLLLLWIISLGCGMEEGDGKADFSKEKSTEELIGILTDENGCNQAAATLALESMGSDAVPELLKAFHREGTEGRHRILAIFYEMGPEAKEAVPTLVALIQDKSAAKCDRFLAVRTLQRIGPGAKASVPALMGLRANQNASAFMWQRPFERSVRSPLRWHRPWLGSCKTRTTAIAFVFCAPRCSERWDRNVRVRCLHSWPS